MRCPVDDAPLREVTRRGVKVDLCSDCRGIWLDRGELEHLLDAASAADDAEERSTPQTQRARTQTPARDYAPDERGTSFQRDDRDDDDYPRGSKKKKRSWLSDLLEFGED